MKNMTLALLIVSLFAAPGFAQTSQFQTTALQVHLDGFIDNTYRDGTQNYVNKVNDPQNWGNANDAAVTNQDGDLVLYLESLDGSEVVRYIDADADGITDLELRASSDNTGYFCYRAGFGQHSGGYASDIRNDIYCGGIVISVGYTIYSIEMTFSQSTLPAGTLLISTLGSVNNVNVKVSGAGPKAPKYTIVEHVLANKTGDSPWFGYGPSNDYTSSVSDLENWQGNNYAFIDEANDKFGMSLDLGQPAYVDRYVDIGGDGTDDLKLEMLDYQYTGMVKVTCLSTGQSISGSTTCNGYPLNIIMYGTAIAWGGSRMEVQVNGVSNLPTLITTTGSNSKIRLVKTATGGGKGKKGK